MRDVIYLVELLFAREKCEVTLTIWPRCRVLEASAGPSIVLRVHLRIHAQSRCSGGRDQTDKKGLSCIWSSQDDSLTKNFIWKITEWSSFS